MQNNFYKFVLASDTLQSVTQSVGDMEERLARLDDSVAHVETLNASVSEHLHEKRAQIEQLSGVYSFMEQLEFLIDLPKRLDAALALHIPDNVRCVPARLEAHPEQRPIALREHLGTFDAWNEAIAFYNQTKDVLTTYGDVATFDALRSQCRARIEQLHNRIAALFALPGTPAESLVALGTLLRALGETAGELCAKLLTVRCEILSSVIGKWRAFPINPATPDEPKQCAICIFICLFSVNVRPDKHTRASCRVYIASFCRLSLPSSSSTFSSQTERYPRSSGSTAARSNIWTISY